MTSGALGRGLGTHFIPVIPVISALICATGAASGCKKESAPPPTTPVAQVPVAKQPPAPEPGTWYRARLAFDGIGELPFFLHVPPQGKNGRAYVVNGDETADFQAEWRDNEVSIVGPWAYTSIIEAQLKPGTSSLE